MACYNRVILMGNLTRDPELKQAPSGTPVVDLRLAVSEQYRDKQTGETKEVTCFVDVTAWSRLAELCSQYLSKGRPILVEGRLQYDEWKNKEGRHVASCVSGPISSASWGQLRVHGRGLLPKWRAGRLPG